MFCFIHIYILFLKPYAMSYESYCIIYTIHFVQKQKYTYWLQYLYDVCIVSLNIIRYQFLFDGKM